MKERERRAFITLATVLLRRVEAKGSAPAKETLPKSVPDEEELTS